MGNGEEERENQKNENPSRTGAKVVLIACQYCVQIVCGRLKNCKNCEKCKICERMRQAPGGARWRRRRSAFESIQINSTAPLEIFRWFNTFKCGSNRVPSDAVKSVMTGSYPSGMHPRGLWHLFSSGPGFKPQSA